MLFISTQATKSPLFDYWGRIISQIAPQGNASPVNFHHPRITCCEALRTEAQVASQTGPQHPDILLGAPATRRRLSQNHGSYLPGQIYTTRLQKGGALVDDMRQLLMVWDGRRDCTERVINENPLASPSRRRLRDVVNRTFVPRFVRSRPANLWKAMAELENLDWPQGSLLPIHYYAAAASEPLLWDFVTQELFERYHGGRHDVSTSDVIRFIDRSPEAKFPGGRWSETVSLKVARGLLAALRDFGLLAGASKKSLAAIYLPTESFAFISLIRHQLGVKGQKVLSDDCWRLFLFSDTAIERSFVEAQQRGYLQYHAAGSIVRIEYPTNDLVEYARVLCG